MCNWRVFAATEKSALHMNSFEIRKCAHSHDGGGEYPMTVLKYNVNQDVEM